MTAARSVYEAGLARSLANNGAGDMGDGRRNLDDTNSAPVEATDAPALAVVRDGPTGPPPARKGAQGAQGAQGGPAGQRPWLGNLARECDPCESSES